MRIGVDARLVSKPFTRIRIGRYVLKLLQEMTTDANFDCALRHHLSLLPSGYSILFECNHDGLFKQLKIKK
jgi:hypothetical protein